jgi:3-deoxy-7-phosphoheptulonate synthase / chorismate mutase
MTDPTIDDLRARISANDRAILDAVNRRLELVQELKRHKESRGIDFVDRNRERQIIDELEAINAGPLSTNGLRGFFTDLLGLTKEEVD